MRKIMACFDVGSDTIKLVVGETRGKKTNILAVADTPCEGYTLGRVVDANLLIKSLKKVIVKCEDMLGLKIRQGIVSVSAVNVFYDSVYGDIEIEKEGNLIDGSDVTKVLAAAIKSKKEKNQEYVTMMPIDFILDDERVVKDPKGLTSKKLSVRGIMVSTLKDNIYPLLECLAEVGIEVVDIAYGPIGDYYEFRNKETDNSIGAIINIGDTLSTISIVNKGIVTNSSVLNVAGKNVNSDISFVYKIGEFEAKKIKEDFALAHKNMAQVSNVIVMEDNLERKTQINQLEVSEVVMSRINEILNLCRKEINCLTKKEISYIIVTGGLTECRDFDILAREVLGDKLMETSIKEIGVRNNKYSTCVGLIKYYAWNAQFKDKDFSIFTIDEQQELSGVNLETQDESMIGKLFGYIFNG